MLDAAAAEAAEDAQAEAPRDPEVTRGRQKSSRESRTRSRSGDAGDEASGKEARGVRQRPPTVSRSKTL
eukprot:4432066-Prymnesium_polylepis.1